MADQESPDGTSDRTEHLAAVVPFPSPTRRPGATETTEATEDDESAPRLRDVLGDVLRDERHRQDRTLADVAERAAVSLPYLSEVERGRKEVSSDLLGAIAEALELPLHEILERSAERARTTTRATRIQMRGGSGIRLCAA